MTEYKEAYKLDTQDVDASVAALGEYQAMLAQLQADDLPRFEARFKELLNENTIREVAQFQSQLHRERETIRERVARINESLTQIDYNPGRFIALEAQVELPNGQALDNCLAVLETPVDGGAALTHYYVQNVGKVAVQGPDGWLYRLVEMRGGARHSD